MSAYRGQSSAALMRAQQMDKLIRNAQIGKGEVELANHLCRDYDIYDPLQRVLEALDPTLIPTASAAELKATLSLLKRVNDAAKCLIRMTTILQSVDRSPRTEALDAYKDRAYTMLTQAWSGITKWMTYLLWCGMRVNPGSMAVTVSDCSQVFIVICQDRENAYKEELLSQPTTVNVLFLLLRQKDQETGRLWDCPTTVGSSVLSNILQRYCSSEAGRHAITGRLFAVPSRTRHAVTESILVRAREAVFSFEAQKVAGATTGIFLIIDAVYNLTSDQATYRIFGQDFLVRFTQDLCLLSEKGAPAMTVPSSEIPSWYSEVCMSIERVVNMAFNDGYHPSRRLATILESGLLRCVFRCLSISTSFPSDPMVGLLRTLLPYLYTAKAVLIRQCVPEPSVFLHDTAPFSAEGLAVWSAARDILHSPANGPFSDWNDRHIVMCDNLKCQRGPFVSQKQLRACSGCHITLYCCSNCQKEDWRNLHSRECRAVAEWYSGAKTQSDRSSTAMRKVYLKLLTHFANESLPPASDNMYSGLGVPEQGIETLLHQRSSTIWTIDASHRGGLAVESGPASSRCLLGQDDMWQERSRQIVLLSQLNPQVVLVQAFFRHNHILTASPFAAVRYSPDAPGKQKYVVIGSVLRVGRTTADMKEGVLQEEPYGAL